MTLRILNMPQAGDCCREWPRGRHWRLHASSRWIFALPRKTRDSVLSLPSAASCRRRPRSWFPAPHRRHLAGAGVVFYRPRLPGAGSARRRRLRQQGGSNGRTSADSARAGARDRASKTAPVSVALIRQMMWRMTGADDPMEARRGRQPRHPRPRHRQPDDVKEGVVSFLEKRPAQFKSKVSIRPTYRIISRGGTSGSISRRSPHKHRRHPRDERRSRSPRRCLRRASEMGHVAILRGSPKTASTSGPTVFHHLVVSTTRPVLAVDQPHRAGVISGRRCEMFIFSSGLRPFRQLPDPLLAVQVLRTASPARTPSTLAPLDHGGGEVRLVRCPMPPSKANHQEPRAPGQPGAVLEIASQRDRTPRPLRGRR